MASSLPNLLRYFGLRYILRHQGRTLLGLVAVALGVALYVSADVANTSVIAAMERTSSARAGKAEWRVTRARSIGVELDVLPAIRALPGAIAAPVIETSGVLVGAGIPLLILGIDFKSDAMLRLYRTTDDAGPIDPATVFATLAAANPILLARELAEHRELERGAKLVLDTPAGRQQFTLTGWFDGGPEARAIGKGLALISIEQAGRLFRKPGWVDHIDVAGVSRDQLEAACPGCTILPAQQPDPLVVDALAQLHALVAVGLIAVLVGIFIVYNTVAVTVLDRLKEIGTLRAIGATRGDIVRALLAEWAVVGMLGSLLGIAGGWALARMLIRFTAEQINALTRVADVHEIVLKPETVAVGMGIGTAAALAAAWVPVRRALARPPVDVLRAHSLRRGQSFVGTFRLGVLCLVLGVLLIWILRHYLTIGIASTCLFFLGLALVLPQLTIWVARWLRPLLARLCRVEGFLAADNTAKFPQRTALTVTALGGSLAMMVASATLIEGFREQSQRWLDRALPFDLAVSSVDFGTQVYASTSFPGSLEDEVRKQPCVGLCYGVRTGFCDVDGFNVMVVAVEVERYGEAQARHPSRHGPHRFQDPAVRASLLAGDGIIVSDNYARLYGTRIGDFVSVATRSGPRRLKVCEVVEEYSWPRGVVFLDLARYREMFGDTTLNFVDVLLAPGQDVAAARTQLVEAVGGASSVWVFAKQDILHAAADKLDQIMLLANIQVLLALLIGFLGILNTLLISVLQRTREVGLLRAIGMSRGQIARTVVLEALLMALVGGALGIAVGLGGGWYPLRLFTMHTTGYWTPAVVPWSYVAAAAALSLVIGALAAWVPARAAARLDVLSAIGYE